MSLINTLKNLGNNLSNVALTRDDIKHAAKKVKVECFDFDPSLQEAAEEIVGIGNLIINNYIRRNEGEDVLHVLNSGIVATKEDLGALGMYEVQEYGGSGRISLLKNLVYKPLHALGAYVHEAGHKVLDISLGYEKAVKERVNSLWKKNPLYALYTAIFGRYLNEGLTDLYFRLRLVGDNGMKSAYQRYGFVDAASYALKRSGGKIRNLVRRLPKAIEEFVDALYNPQLAPIVA